MSSWYTAWLPWLPGLPSIDFALPSSIQRRFISFALKKSLGHLLRPGQLDVNQIDSQIGSGYVQVNDLELDNEAINSVLADLPVKLHDGSISAVTARIPWPNPLTSTLGFSVQSLHLVFHLVPVPRQSTSASVINLADSVASVAESFIHDELTPREEATLRESIQPDLAPSLDDHSHHVPGSMDPFIHSTDEEEFNSDVDPAGVSIFAALIERLLARFEFDAIDTKITLVHPEHSSFTFSVAELRYGTESVGGVALNEQRENTDSGEQGNLGQTSGETRKIIISGFNVTARSLTSPMIPSPTPMTPSAASPTSPSVPKQLPTSPRASQRSATASPASSSSSLDEDTEMMMSQSLAYLPARDEPASSSPSSSMTSSLYQSAISDKQHASEYSSSRSSTPSPGDHRPFSDAIASHSAPGSSQGEQTNEADFQLGEDKMLSFGAEPIVIRLTTPPVPASTDTPSEDRRTPLQSAPMSSSKQKLRLTYSAGVIACALRAWHIRSLMDIMNAWGSHHSPEIPEPISKNTPPGLNSVDKIFALGLDAKVTIRGLVLLLLPSLPLEPPNSSDALENFFFRPLVTPHLRDGCVRVSLDMLEAECSLSNSVASVASIPKTQTRNMEIQTSQNTPIVTLAISLKDISAFALLSLMNSATGVQGVTASPILITDPNLAAQYPPPHIHPDARAIAEDRHNYPELPEIGVLDWTNEKHQEHSTRISTWRDKAKARISKRRESATRLGAGLSPFPGRPSSFGTGDDTQQNTHVPAITVKAKFHLLPSSLGHTKEGAHEPQVDNYVHVNAVPLHIFVDLGLALSFDHALAFVETVMGGDVAHNQDDSTDSDDDDEDDNLPQDTSQKPHAKQETERQRLERMIMEDLNLELDYRPPEFSKQEKPIYRKPQRSKQPKRVKGPNIKLNISMIRVQLRCPPPPTLAPRSGAIVLDFHGIDLSTETEPTYRPRFSAIDVSSPPPDARSDDSLGQDVLFTVHCQRIALASSLVGKDFASIVLSVGPLSSTKEDIRANATSPPGEASHSSLRPRISLSRSYYASTSSAPSEVTAVTFDIPSIHVDISKPLLDGIQLWADDVSQLVERTFGTDTDTERADSRNPSLIGSRFFSKSKRYGSKSSEESNSLSGDYAQTRSETVINVLVSEVFARLKLPREGEDTSLIRPFDIAASDIDVLVELKPEGKDETVVTLGVMDLNVSDTSDSGNPLQYISGTPSRNLLAKQPKVKLRITSVPVPENEAKEARVKGTLWGLAIYAYPDLKWVEDLSRFVKAPPGAFESVIPSERTRLSIKIVDCSIQALAPSHPGAVVLYVGDFHFSTDIVGDSPETSFHLSIPSVSLLLIDDTAASAGWQGRKQTRTPLTTGGVAYWKDAGYATLADVADLDLKFQSNKVAKHSDTRITISRLGLRVHLCADTLHALTAFISDLTSAHKPPADTSVPQPKKRPTTISEQAPTKRGIMSSVDENAFRRVPDVGNAPDMINDDLPANLDYLDESFGAAAGLRELRDDDLDEFDLEDAEKGRVTPTQGAPQLGIISNVGGETIKLLQPLDIVDNYFDTLPPESASGSSELGETTVRVRVRNCDVALLLYDGYDWARTRKTIEEEVKEMRRRLTKIRQLVASGQTQDPSVEDTSALLFNSVYIGLDQDVDELEPGAFIAAIDDELDDDIDNESQSSWQSLRPPAAGKPRVRTPRVHGKRLTRSKGPSIEFKLSGVNAEVDQYRPGEPFVSRTLATVRDLEILDHIKTSTWQKFLTELRSDSRGNVRETDSNMVRVELRTVRPVPNNPSEEARLRAKILPLRLYVDQDALDFLKKFFSFKDPDSESVASTAPSDGDIYFQHAEVFPVDIKLDYKPRRVDYRALREGKTIELMNFFHFDGSEMTLRHITLSGITGWPRFFDMLNDLWTPDVKATQLVDVISGVSPIRSVVNVGSGVADLVLLPIAQYKKDGRIVRGMQKGTTAFVKSTAMEAVKLGARLATGTQVILEQAEHVLGGQFSDSITAETLQSFPEDFVGPEMGSSDDEDVADLFSKYAEQPLDVKEGVQSAYKSLQKNLNSAAQTILAVPMEVYERSGNEGPVRAVIRAVPIAVLKPMIGASEAVSKTLMGLQNTMDPNIRHENEDKYKHR